MTGGSRSTPQPPRGSRELTYLGMPTAPAGVGGLRGDRSFPKAARAALADPQLREWLIATGFLRMGADGTATPAVADPGAVRNQVVADTIKIVSTSLVGLSVGCAQCHDHKFDPYLTRDFYAFAAFFADVKEVPDWEELREAGRTIKDATMARLDEHLVQLEAAVEARGGKVHWARDAIEANALVVDLVRATGQAEVVKIKSMATQEIGLNEALEAAGIAAYETDLAELIVQLGHDTPSHILVPAIHRNRSEIRDIFLREMPDADPALTDDPHALAEAARRHLRRRFLAAGAAVSGVNFAVAETGTLAVVESEGNGRMCLTLPETLITVMGIEKVIPRWRDL